MSAQFVPVPGVQVDFTGQWLMMPSVSIGGAPQLAIDLLISTMQMKRVGYLNEPDIMPMACMDPCDVGTTGITTAFEVYQAHDKRCTIIQQRAAEWPRCRQAIVDHVLTFAQANGFIGVFLLGSTNVSRRPNAREAGSIFRFATANASNPDVHTMVARAIDRDILQLEHELDEYDTSLASQIEHLDSVPMLHNAGISRRMLVSAQSIGVPIFMLCVLAADGDNTRVAHVMLDHAVHVLTNIADATTTTTTTTAWRIPSSWHVAYKQNYTQELFH